MAIFNLIFDSIFSVSEGNTSIITTREIRLHKSQIIVLVEERPTFYAKFVWHGIGMINKVSII